jgi:hypothetical protein
MKSTLHPAQELSTEIKLGMVQAFKRLDTVNLNLQIHSILCSSAMGRRAHLEMSRFSWTNLTLARVSAVSSIAWLKPFSPPGFDRGQPSKC